MKDEAGQGKVHENGGRLFHLRIAGTAKNSVLLRIVGELFSERYNPLFVRLGDYFENAKYWEAAIAEHEEVVEAIAAGSADRARDAMGKNLKCSHDRFAANWAMQNGLDIMLDRKK